jgi:hypothetical protein
MPTLKKWIDREGPEGRRQLFKAIKAKYPNFTQVSLTNYIHDQRLPDLRVAQIIADVTGIPIFLLPFRYKNKP